MFQSNKNQQACDSILTDAIAIALFIGKIVSQVCSVNGYHLSTGQDPSNVPVHFGIPKGRPAVLGALLNEFVPGAIDGCREQRRPLPPGIVKGHGASGVNVGLDVLQKRGGFPVPRKFGIVAIEVANSVGEIKVASPEKIGLL